MVGFTELSYKLDPEAHADRHSQPTRRPATTCVNRYEGYVFRMLGDGVVAFFGFPLAHESEAERAVRAGLDIVEAIARLHLPGVGRLQVRIGIASGMVVVASGERNAVGETMNLASRLQTIAKPGSVVVSESVRRMAGGGFEYEDLGEKELKGVSGPTRVYRVLGVSRAESRFEAATQRGLTPIVGRDAEISALLDDWRQVRETGVGTGDPAARRSRYRKEPDGQCAARAPPGRSPADPVFQCSPFFVNSAFYPIRASFERALLPCRGQRCGSPAGQARGAAHRPSRPRPGRHALDRGVAFDSPCQQRYGAILLSPKLAKEETMRVLIEIVRAQARAGPTLLLFEDAHWADPTSLDLLGRFIEMLPGIPALLVITARPEFNAPW